MNSCNSSRAKMMLTWVTHHLRGYFLPTFSIENLTEATPHFPKICCIVSIFLLTEVLPFGKKWASDQNFLQQTRQKYYPLNESSFTAFSLPYRRHTFYMAISHLEGLLAAAKHASSIRKTLATRQKQVSKYVFFVRKFTLLCEIFSFFSS